MTATKAQKQVPVAKKSDDEYAKMGRELEALYTAVNPRRGTFYRAAFLKGVLSGIGGVIGATVGIALLLWILSLFNTIPFIGPITESVQDTIQTGATD